MPGGVITGPAIQIRDTVGRIGFDGTGLATWSETPIRLPGLDPTDRTARGSDGYNSFFGPGLAVDETAEWREQIGVFDTNRVPTTRNTCRFWGWNYAAGGTQINPDFGSIGGSEEASYQPPSPAETWQEIHWRITPPGGTERRLVSGHGSETTGATSIFMAGTVGNLFHVTADGATATQLISWTGLEISVGGTGFYYFPNNQGFNRQFNSAGTAYTLLPYADANNRIVIGMNLDGNVLLEAVASGLTTPLKAAAAVTNPPSGYVTYFTDSADGLLKQKNSSGTVTPV